MTQEEIIRTAQEMATAGRPFVLATVDQAGVPQVRWMIGCVLGESLTVSMATSANSRKLAQIAAYPQAQLMFHNEDYSRVATVSGTCQIVEALEYKRRLWEAMPELAEHVSGPQDPDFGVIEFEGRRVEVLTPAEGFTPEVAKL